jgi:hypothetical protein
MRVGRAVDYAELAGRDNSVVAEACRCFDTYQIKEASHGIDDCATSEAALPDLPKVLRAWWRARMDLKAITARPELIFLD